MIIAFYVVAGLAALLFVAAGAMKVIRPKAALHAAGMTYVEDFSAPTIKLIGLAEVLGGIGLVVPMLTGIAPILSPIAAICLTIIMVGAVVVHARRKEPVTVALVLAILAAIAGVLGFLVL